MKTVTARMPELVGTPRWLVLVHQLPPRPSNVRVRVWRRLQQLGAAVLRNSVYVLPNTGEAREDFSWVCSEIAAVRGQASVLEANAIDGYTDEELIQQFRSSRAEDYRRLAKDAEGTRRKWLRASTPPSRARRHQELRILRERLARIEAADYFGAPMAREARAAIDALTLSLAPATPSPPSAPVLEPAKYSRRMWITRPRPGIDRMASAWLVRRFIDPYATFRFATVERNARRNGALPFDMPGVEFGHHGPDCTFETFMRRFGVRDRAAVQVGRVVHDLDLKESRYGLPECVAIGRIVEGLRLTYADDTELLEHGMVMIESLYQSFAKNLTPSVNGRQRGAARRAPTSLLAKARS